MDIVPFRDYSDALVPLPALPTERSDTDAWSISGPRRSFRDELDDRLAAPDNSSLFDLRSPLTDAARPADSFQSRVTPLNPIAASDNPDELMLVCREIEGLLLGILLKNLGKSDSENSLFSKSWESSVYKDMFFTEVAKSIGSNPPGLGIADVLYRDIIMKEGGAIEELA